MRTVGDGVASLQHSLSGRGDGFSPRLAAPLTEAAQGVNAYAGQFAGIVGERRALGVRENDGLQGRLRAAAAEVEAEVPAENDAVVNLVLQLRCYEQTFLIQGNIGASSLFEALYAAIITVIGHAPADSTPVRFAPAQGFYRDAFRAMARTAPRQRRQYCRGIRHLRSH